MKRALLDKDDPLYDKTLDDAQTDPVDPPNVPGKPNGKAKAKGGAKTKSKEELLNKLKTLMQKKKDADGDPVDEEDGDEEDEEE